MIFVYKLPFNCDRRTARSYFTFTDIKKQEKHFHAMFKILKHAYGKKTAKGYGKPAAKSQKNRFYSGFYKFYQTAV